MKIQKTDNRSQFKANPSKNILYQVEQELNGNKAGLEKFMKLFQDTFKRLDTKTVVDMDKYGNYRISHANFPGILIKENLKTKSQSTFAQKVLNTCEANLLRMESKLLKKVISILVNSGKNFEEIADIGLNRLDRNYLKSNFLELINIAKRIKEKNPQSRLTLRDFYYEEVLKEQEELHKLWNSEHL